MREDPFLYLQKGYTRAMITHLFFTCAVVLSAVAFPGVSSAQQEQQEQVMLEGRVMGPNNEPVAGARLYLAVSDNWYSRVHGYGNVQATPAFLGTSREDGSFRVMASRADVEPGLSGAKLIALGPEDAQLGVDWQAARVFNKSDPHLMERSANDSSFAEQLEAARILRLPKDVAIEGRLVRGSGGPVAGVQVTVIDLHHLRDDGMEGYLEFAKRDNPRDYDDARIKHREKACFGEKGRLGGFGELIRATTDAEGRFKLYGFGANRVGWLLIEGPGIATEHFLVRSAPGPTIAIRDGDAAFPFHGCQFEHTVTDAVTIVGRVVESDSRSSLAGVVVENRSTHRSDTRMLSLYEGICRAVTDADGRYELKGLPQGETIRLLASSPSTPHWPSFQTVTGVPGRASTTVDWELTRGVWIEGRVWNADTGRGVWCDMHYFAFSDNPHAASCEGFSGSLSYPSKSLYSTDPAGRYRLPGLRGRGLVTVRVIADQDGSRFATNKGQQQIAGARGSGRWTVYDTLPINCRPAMFHGISEVNIGRGEERYVLDFPLMPSRTLRGRVLDPEGRTLKGYKYGGASEVSFFMHPNENEEFLVPKYDPSFPRRLVFWHKERQLAGTIVLEGDQSDLIEVKLQPQGSLVGRVVDEKGLPLAGILLEVPPLLEPDPPTTISPLPEANYKTDAEGRFRIEGVAPGMLYNLVTEIEGRMWRVVVDAEAESGHTKDLGELRLLPLQ